MTDTPSVSEIPKWVCMGENIIDLDKSDPMHLCMTTQCKKHPFSGGCSLPQEAIQKLIDRAVVEAKIKMLENMKKSLTVAHVGGFFNGEKPIQLPRDVETQKLIEAEFDRNIAQLSAAVGDGRGSSQDSTTPTAQGHEADNLSANNAGE